MNAKQVWQATLERIRKKVSVAVFTTWFQGTSALAFQEGVLIIRVPTTFVKKHLDDRFTESIRSILSEVTGTSLNVRFEVAKEQPKAPDPIPYVEVEMPKRIHRRPPIPNKRNPEPTPASPHQQKMPYQNVINKDFPPSIPKSKPPQINFSVDTAKPIHRWQFGEPSVRTNTQQPHPAETADQSQDANTPTHCLQSGDKLRRDSASARPEEGQGRHGEGLPIMESLLIARYTFDTFIPGSSNQLAHAAALAVSENPGRLYNPLFLYGGVGLGKTHLLHAIGHVGEATGLYVLYTTSEKFTNEIINAIRYQKTEEFRAKYRQIDILLVDDIQFIAGKASTEEEFFHTFNSLHTAGKQIVVTSDRPPKAINSLQDRLRSRFEWGLLVDVQAPEYEHRFAILRSKADLLRFPIPPGVVDYIARQPCTSVRELEGALNRVVAYATLHDMPVSAETAAQALAHLYESKPIVPPSRSPATLTASEVLKGVCHYYNINVELLRGKQRGRDIVWPRQVAMYLMRQETNTSLAQIGSALGGRDHTTIIHGWEKVQTEMTKNERVRQEIATLLESLRQQHT